MGTLFLQLGVQTLVGSKKGKKKWHQATGGRPLARSDHRSLWCPVISARALFVCN
jgi:hypothetical protein